MAGGDDESPLCMKDRWTISDALWMIDGGPFPVPEGLVKLWQHAVAIELDVDVVPGFQQAVRNLRRHSRGTLLPDHQTP